MSPNLLKIKIKIYINNRKDIKIPRSQDYIFNMSQWF